MKGLLTLIFGFFALGLSAQISVSPNPLVIQSSPSVNDVKYEIYFTNTKDTIYDIFWQIAKDGSWPSAWETQVCDPTALCFDWNVDKCPNGAPSKFSKGTYKFELHFKANDVAAYSLTTFKLFTQKNMGGEILSVPFVISTLPVSVKDVSVSAIKIFPNPASDYFQVGNGNQVDRIIIYNLIGKEVKSLFHYNNAQHEIDELKAGMYVVKMFDSKGKHIKSLKLNKIYGGA
jgi:hypothetical protein